MSSLFTWVLFIEKTLFFKSSLRSASANLLQWSDKAACRLHKLDSTHKVLHQSYDYLNFALTLANLSQLANQNTLIGKCCSLIGKPKLWCSWLPHPTIKLWIFCLGKNRPFSYSKKSVWIERYFDINLRNLWIG